MAASKANMVVVLIATAALIAGTLAVYSVGELLDGQKADPREAAHEYTVTGVIGDSPCSGRGYSEYTPESDAYFTYYFSLETADETGKPHSLAFGMIFEADSNQPPENLYSFLGTDAVGSTEVSVWTHSENGYDYRFYVGEDCTVLQFEITSPALSLRGQIAE